MDKRQLHHFSTQFKKVKPIYFVGIAVTSGVVCVFALRANNQHMIQLRQTLYTADKNNTDVQKPLQELQIYVTSHMNTDLSVGATGVYPPVQLKYTYDRLVKAQGEQVAQSNTKIYNDAQQYCEAQNHTDVSGRNRVPCIEEYVQQHTAATSRPIPDALYKFSFATPTWSPDLAGWSMAIAVMSSVAAVFSFLLGRWLRRQS